MVRGWSGNEKGWPAALAPRRPAWPSCGRWARDLVRRGGCARYPSSERPLSSKRASIRFFMPFVPSTNSVGVLTLSSGASIRSTTVTVFMRELQEPIRRPPVSTLGNRAVSSRIMPATCDDRRKVHSLPSTGISRNFDTERRRQLVDGLSGSATPTTSSPPSALAPARRMSSSVAMAVIAERRASVIGIVMEPQPSPI